MLVDEEIADLVLHHLGRSGVQPALVVIGAMDGVSFDDFHGYITLYRWSGLFVEPIPEQFRRLQETYARLPHRPANRYENCAIADHDGTVEMLTIDQHAIDTGAVHPCFGGMSAIYPPRNGLASEADAETVAKYGRRIEVSCLTLPSLFARHGVERVDVFCVDAEGWDSHIVGQLDLATFRPKLIRCEYINMTADEQAAIVARLGAHDYVIHLAGQNLDAAPRELWAALESERAQARAQRAAPAPRRPEKPPLVTALFDLSAREPAMRLRHRFALHLDQFKRLLVVDWPMVIFVQPELAELVRRYRSPASTYVITRPLADLQAFPFLPQVMTIRGAANAGAPPSGCERQSDLPLYAPYVLSKQFFLNDAVIYDPFAAAAYLWVDGGIADAIGEPAHVFSDECAANLMRLLADDRMLYLCRPWRAAAANPGFAPAALARFLGHEPEWQVLGSVFGGAGAAVNAINGVYYSVLGQTLAANCLGSEEEVTTIVAATNPHLCALQRLAGADQLAAFFDRLQYGVPDQAVATP